MTATLQELTPLGAAQRDPMIRAAQAARTQWQRAGTWLEVERAEYRLALCWLAAEALCLPSRALGDSAGHAAALANARQAFDALASDDRVWCRATLDRIVAS